MPGHSGEQCSAPSGAYIAPLYGLAMLAYQDPPWLARRKDSDVTDRCRGVAACGSPVQRPGWHPAACRGPGQHLGSLPAAGPAAVVDALAHRAQVRLRCGHRRALPAALRRSRAALTSRGWRSLSAHTHSF